MPPAKGGDACFTQGQADAHGWSLSDLDQQRYPALPGGFHLASIPIVFWKQQGGVGAGQVEHHGRRLTHPEGCQLGGLSSQGQGKRGNQQEEGTGHGAS